MNSHSMKKNNFTAFTTPNAKNSVGTAFNTGLNTGFNTLNREINTSSPKAIQTASKPLAAENGVAGNSSKNNKSALIQKVKQPAFKLDEKMLLYSENGIKKLYNICEKTEFKENRSDVQNLNKLVQVFKNWHFILCPKYDVDFFLAKVNEIGKKPSGRVK